MELSSGNLSSNTRSSHLKYAQIGQGMTEYIIIVAIIAIGAVTASGFFGARVQTQFVSMGNEISGQEGNPVGSVAAPTPAPATLGTYVNN